MKNNYSFLDFAPDYIQFSKHTGEVTLDDDFSEDKEYIDDVLKKLDEYDDVELLNNVDMFQEFLYTSKDNLAKYLYRYFKAADGYYYYNEYKYPRFGGFYQHFVNFIPDILYLCGKYFESISANKIDVVKCYLFLLASKAYYPNGDCFGDFIEDKFDMVKDYLGADWLTVHPQICWNIGKYYLEKENYERALIYFKHGASIDYDNRQSIEPFIEVGKNEYEVGLMYLNGLGVNKDYEIAYNYFESAARDAEEDYIPIMGDMYYEHLIDADDGDNDEMAYLCYSSSNKFTFKNNVYYKMLNEDQEKRMKELESKR